MKGLGISAVALTVLSFLFWLISWAYWTYQQFVPYDSANYESQKTIRYVMQGISFISSLTEYLAILLIGIALVLVVKRLPKI